MTTHISTSPRSVSSKETVASSSTPKKKNFLNKLLRRKSVHHNLKDTMDKGSINSKNSSGNTTLVESNARDIGISRSHSGRSSSRRSLWIDEDETSMYNHAENESRNQFSDSATSSDEESLYSSHSEDFRTEEEFQSNLDVKINDYYRNFFGETERNVWEGLTCEALVTPKYIRTVRRSKHSPKNLRHLFLAQELKTNEVEEDESNTNSNEEANVERDGGSLDSENEGHKEYNESYKETLTDKTHEIFVMKFSKDGKYLATAGRDATIRVWKVIASPLSRLEFNQEKKFNETKDTKKNSRKRNIFESASIFHEKPVRVFKGHKHSILSLDWSKNNFLLTGSMDRTAKLWHVERPQCLDTFEHDDFVTTVNFHPNDDRFFLSGSVDNCVRLWSILEKEVSYSRNLDDDVLITSLSFTPDGRSCIIGGLNGTVIALETMGLHIKKRLEVKNRSIAHPFNRYGNKITGFRLFKNENYNENDPKLSDLDQWNVLVTTNDSKIRLVNPGLRKLVTRFKGLTNNSSSIVACISDDHRYIISGSEDDWCYIWENNNAIINNKLRNGLKELLMDGKQHLTDYTKKSHKYGKLIHENKLFKKLNIKKFLEDTDDTSEYVSNENNSYVSFHSHNTKVNCAIFAPDITRRAIELSDDIIYDLLNRGRLANKYGIKNKNGKTFKQPETNDSLRGQIIVTTDQTGIIRVFRQDSAYEIRNYLLRFGGKNRNSKTCMVSQKSLNLQNDGRDRSKTPNLARSISPSSNNFRSKVRLRSKTNGSLPDSGKPPMGLLSSLSLPAIPKTVSSNSLISESRLQKLPLARNFSDNDKRFNYHRSMSDSDSDTSELMNSDTMLGSQEKVAVLQNIEKKTDYPFPNSRNSNTNIPLKANAD